MITEGLLNMRESPTISIVTVVKDNFAGLLESAQVIASQTYSKVEHVVIDGQSSDGTTEWLESYLPEYEVNWVSEEDSGLYDAMNKGIRISAGDLIVFLNGGDKFSSPDVLAHVAADWQAGSWEWGYGAIRNVSESDRTIVDGYLHAPFRKRRLELGIRFVPHPATYMSRSLLLKLGGFKPEFGVSADQELIIRAADVSSPYVWVEFMSDFVLGGMSTQNSGTAFYSRFGKIRKANGILLGNSRIVDAIFVFSQQFFYRGRAAAARLVR